MGIVSTGAIIGAAAIGAAGPVGAAAIGAGAQNKQARRARDRANALSAEMDELELTRQDVINPYDDVVSLDDMIVDNTGILSVSYTHLTLPTKASG